MAIKIKKVPMNDEELARLAYVQEELGRGSEPATVRYCINKMYYELRRRAMQDQPCTAYECEAEAQR